MKLQSPNLPVFHSLQFSSLHSIWQHR